jgi:hypothetical protein
MAGHLPLCFTGKSCTSLGLALLLPLILLPGGVLAEAVTPIQNPCAGATNIVADGGFEAEAGYWYPLSCPCPLISPWVMNRSGKGEALAQTGWGDEGWYSAVLSLNDSAPGDWILLSQEVSGGRYCMLKFAWNTWLTDGRQGELSVYLDNVRIFRLVPSYKGKLPFHYRDIVNVSTFSGNHTLRFQWKVFNSSTGHADMYLDDVWLMAYPGGPGGTGAQPVTMKTTPAPVTTRLRTTSTTQARPLITQNETPSPTIPAVTMTPLLPPALQKEQATPRPVITKPAPFNPVQYLSCLARWVHDKVFPFIPLKPGVDPGCT